MSGITVAGSNVSGASFGIQQPPVATGGSAPTQPNPGGTTAVDLSSRFVFSDPDGSVQTVTFTQFPANVTTVSINGITYVAPGQTPGAGQQVWPAGNLTVPATGLSVLVDPVDGQVISSVPFFVTDNGGFESNVGTVSAAFILPGVSVSGHIVHDGNGLTDNTVGQSGSLTNIPTGLYASLVDNTGSAVATVAVNPDGSYDYGNVQPGTYSVVLHQTPGGSTVPGLPAGWKSTGEHVGAGAGSDGTINGILPGIVVGTTAVPDVNLGIQQPPASDLKDYLIDQPSTDVIITLNGSHVSTGSGTSAPGQLTGSDPEDGVLNGSGKNRTVVISTLPDHGELYYNGVLVTQGQVIPNYDPALMGIKLTGTGYTSTTFQYSYVDGAGVQSAPVSYSIRWDKPLPVTLVSFTASARENVAELTWVTSQQTNSDRFEIQRSGDGRNWQQIGSVKAQGEDHQIRNYVFSDQAPASGENLYRLKMIDLDGSFALSTIRSVRFEQLVVAAYPNPASERLLIRNHQQVSQLALYNANGMKVYGSQTVTAGGIDISRLTPGIYTLSVRLLDGSITHLKVAVVH